MKQLPSIVHKYQDTFILVKRTNNVAIYSRSNGDYYEAFIVNQNKERTINGNIIPAAEALPYNEQFGRTAYCCTSLERALIRFNQLLNNTI